MDGDRELAVPLPGWAAEQRADLSFLLGESGITSRWEDDILVTPLADEDHVRRLIAYLSANPSNSSAWPVQADDEFPRHGLTSSDRVEVSGLRVAFVLGLATITALLVVVVWMVADLPHLAESAVGCFIGMLFITAMPVGKLMSDGFEARIAERRAIGRRGLREINHAVRDGREVHDVALALYAVDRCEYMQRFALFSSGTARWWLPAGLVVLTGFGIASGSLVEALVPAVLLCLWPLLDRRRAHVLRMAEQSATANRQLLRRSGK